MSKYIPPSESIELTDDLIKASSDLLMACKKAFLVMDDLRSYPAAMSQIGPICRDYLDGAIESIKNAIMKAEPYTIIVDYRDITL